MKAKGIRGFLLYSPATQSFIFRVYESEDKRQFTDYDICVDDLEIEILDQFAELHKGERNKIDYSKKVLGR